MFEHLKAVQPDPILSLMAQFASDERTNKMDLGIGVYRNDEGQTPVMTAIKQAQQAQANQQTSKGYLGLTGNFAFNQAITELTLGSELRDDLAERIQTIQTPGASGALRLLADLIKSQKPNGTVWISDPSYVNHQPIMEAAGLTVKTYPYFDGETKQVKEPEMLKLISTLGKDDIVLLHGCCHNPTGADISNEAWDTITELALKNGFLPFVDIAYQGFGDGLTEDAYGLRKLAASVEEMVIASSCSKNFGLYRERTGAAMVIGKQAEHALNARDTLTSLARKTYTMSPDHGADLVARVLLEEPLKALWEKEIGEMLTRLKGLRAALVTEFQNQGQSNRFDYFAQHKGMFSVTGLRDEQIQQLKQDHGIYIVKGGRVNVAGLTQSDIPNLVKGFIAVKA